MERKIECINFDLDSVLYIPSDFLEAALLMTIRAMTETGLKASPKKALKVLKEIRSVNPNAKDHFDQLCLHFNGTSDPLIIAAGIEKYWDCKIGMMITAPETKITLSSLYKKYPLAIVSNGPSLKQAGKIVRLGLSHFFSRGDTHLKVQKHLFYAASEKRKMKPYPFLWLKSRKEIGYRFSRALMVGDRYWEDIFGARRLGMIAVKVNQGPHHQESVSEAFERIFRTRPEVSFFMKRHGKDEILRLMEPHYTIPSLGELEKTVDRIEKNLNRV